jgi:hypothetical protein
MAEIGTILGVAAAATQLLHYTYLLISGTSALSHQLRHAPDRIRSWNEKPTSMLSLLDDIYIGCRECHSAIIRLAQQFRSELVAIRSLLRLLRLRSSARKTSKREAAIFVLRRKGEIEARLASLEHTFNIMALSLLTDG